MFLLDLNAFLCSLNLCVKHSTVSLTYALLQSGHVSLYAPDLLYSSQVWGFVISSFWSVLLVRRVILMSAFLKRFVIKVVSLLKYMKGAHLCVGVLEKRQIPCPCGNEHRGLVTTDSASTLPKHRLCRTFFPVG